MEDFNKAEFLKFVNEMADKQPNLTMEELIKIYFDQMVS